MSRPRGVDAVRIVDGVRVRWRYGNTRGLVYLCDEHGTLTAATCNHALAAARTLAPIVLGVYAYPDPTTGDNTHD